MSRAGGDGPDTWDLAGPARPWPGGGGGDGGGGEPDPYAVRDLRRHYVRDADADAAAH